MTLNKLVVIFVAVLFSMQLISLLPREVKKSNSPYQKYGIYLEEIRETFGKKMFDEFSLIPQGGSGQMHEKIEVIGMKFSARRRATIEEARILHLLVMDRFVKEINAHEKIQPFLEVSPITYKRIHIEISYKGPNGSYSDGGVEYVFNVHGKAVAIENRNHFFYFTNDPFTNKSIDLFEESIEEAFKRAEASTDVNPHTHRSTYQEAIIDQIFTSFIKKMEKKHGLEYVSIGGKINPSIEGIGAKFVLVKRTTKEEARALLLAVVEQLLQMINSNESLNNNLVEYPFPSNRLKIRISFTKKNYYSYSDGSMESVALENNEVTYYQELPPNAQMGPINTPIFAKEGYQEALRSGQQ
ncbi:MAG: hypothetical protein H0V82_11460 [Candidatus Protochlamydia sp.]|nr:hypothetical protein [Candidatus Protochlamydia sp.]